MSKNKILFELQKKEEEISKDIQNIFNEFFFAKKLEEDLKKNMDEYREVLFFLIRECSYLSRKSEEKNKLKKLIQLIIEETKFKKANKKLAKLRLTIKEEMAIYEINSLKQLENLNKLKNLKEKRNKNLDEIIKNISYDIKRQEIEEVFDKDNLNNYKNN
jgi:hypothetical protein